MNKLTILLFSILISFNSYGEWKEIHTRYNGNTYYIDTGTIKEHGGYVYYWSLDNYLEPNGLGDMSEKKYIKTDCGVNRFKILSFIFYQQPMGEGVADTRTRSPDTWFSGDTSVGTEKLMLDYICDYVK